MRSRGAATGCFIWNMAAWSRCPRNRSPPDATDGSNAGLKSFGALISGPQHSVPVIFGGRRSRERQAQKARGLTDREQKKSGVLLERSHVRTVHGKGPARHLLRTVRSKPVWFPVHRDGAPSARTVARRQSAYQSVSAITRFPCVHPQADRGPYDHTGKSIDLRGPAPE